VAELHPDPLGSLRGQYSASPYFIAGLKGEEGREKKEGGETGRNERGRTPNV